MLSLIEGTPSGGSMSEERKPTEPNIDKITQYAAKAYDRLAAAWEGFKKLLPSLFKIVIVGLILFALTTAAIELGEQFSEMKALAMQCAMLFDGYQRCECVETIGYHPDGYWHFMRMFHEQCIDTETLQQLEGIPLIHLPEETIVE